MIILPQIIETKWNSKYVKYYKSKGYVYTGIGTDLEVNVLDLPLASTIAVKAFCDYCDEELVVGYFRANVNMKVSCNHCKSKRTKEVYGWSSTWELEKTKESIKRTNVKRYGVEHNSYNPGTIEKRKQTLLKNYGVTSPLKSQIIKDKIKLNNMKKYGVEHTSTLLSTKNKLKQTNVERYGVDSIFKIPEIMKKANINRLKSLYKNGTGICSKQQKYIHDLVKGELCYPVSQCQLDIAFPDEMIYIEYDGGGHNLNVKMGQITQDKFNMHEIRRQKYLQSLSWKLIRIVSLKDKLLSDEQFTKLINNAKQYLLNSSHTWVEINIDEMKVINAIEAKIII